LFHSKKNGNIWSFHIIWLILKNISWKRYY
jgi:hypothetical protein